LPILTLYSSKSLRKYFRKFLPSENEKWGGREAEFNIMVNSV
jgi:hypothetical protein